MCITSNNPSEPCCDDPLQRCKACPEVDWKSFTWLWSHDEYQSGTEGNGDPIIRPAHEGKMTQVSQCDWQLDLPLSVEGSEYQHFFAYVHLTRARVFYDLDREWWRIHFRKFVDPSTAFAGPYNFDPFLCTGEMVLTKSQERYDALGLQSGLYAGFNVFPDTIRLQRVSGQGPELADPFPIL